MSRTIVFLIAVAAGLACGCTEPDPGGRAGLSAAPIGGELRLVLALAEGNGPGEVTVRTAAEEVAASGPQALAVGPDGTVHLADTLGGRIVRLRPDGEPLPPLACPWVEDVLVDDEGRVHGLSRARRLVAVFSAAGEPLRTVGLPATMRWVGGLAPDEGGGAALRTAYQESVSLEAEDLHRELGEGVPGRDGLRYRTVRRPGEAWIEVVSRRPDPEPRWAVSSRTAVEVGRGPGSVAFVGATAEGEVLVDLQEVNAGAPVEVDRVLRRYGPDGQLRGEAPMPRGPRAAAHAASLGPDGTAWVLRPTAEGVEVWAWPGGGAR